jgi:dienelactone hydrolase
MSDCHDSFSPTAHHQVKALAAAPFFRWKGGDLRKWQAAWRSKLTELLGLDKLRREEKTPLNSRSRWKRNHEFGTIEKFILTMEEGVDAPVYLCLPHQWSPPGPVFICLQGHSTGMHNSIAVAQGDENQTIDVEGDRDFGIGCMKRGIAALCLEQRAFGEREDVNRNTEWVSRCHNTTLRALLLGRTLLGERVYDVDRAIDFLESQKAFDSRCIGVMGNSGGGTVSLLAGALLDRITHIMPSCSFCTLADSIMSVDHCECNYVPGLLEWAETAEIAGLCAPKPLVVVNGKYDDLFPIEAAQKEFERLQSIYQSAGAGDRCLHVIGEGGHRFYAEKGWSAMSPKLPRGPARK